MVAGVAAEEPQPCRRSVGRTAHQLGRQPHGVAQPETEHVAVEVQRLGIVAGGQHDVPQSLLGGHEAVAVGTDHTPVLEGGAVKDLELVSGGIRETDHLVDAAILEFGGRRLLVGNPLDIEGIPDPLQSFGVGALPARLHQPVMLPGNDDQPGREIIHPQVKSALHRTPALDHAEHLQPVVAPRPDVGGLDAQVAERPDGPVGHQTPPRKWVVRLLNSSNFST